MTIAAKRYTDDFPKGGYPLFLSLCFVSMTIPWKKGGLFWHKVKYVFRDFLGYCIKKCKYHDLCGSIRASQVLERQTADSSQFWHGSAFSMAIAIRKSKPAVHVIAFFYVLPFVRYSRKEWQRRFLSLYPAKKCDCQTFRNAYFKTMTITTIPADRSKAGLAWLCLCCAWL